jgi:hypothetical protein
MGLPRHQCLIYNGPPSRYLGALAALIVEKRRQHYRCFYLNSRPMIAGLRSYLAAAGMDVLEEIANGSLILTSEQSHLREGQFDLDSMIESLRDLLDEARDEGYAGLWASGDMAWEFGPKKDFSQLLEYEWRLEELFRERADLCGVCQYLAGTLPQECLREGLIAHPTLFVSETLSRINPHYLPRESFSHDAASSAANTADVESAVLGLLRAAALPEAG